MASIFKANGSDIYSIVYTDEFGQRKKKSGGRDKGVAKETADKLERDVRRRKEGLADPEAEAFAKHAATELGEHLSAWRDYLSNKGGTAAYVELSYDRVVRLVALVEGFDPDVATSRIDGPDRRKTREALDTVLADARFSCVTRRAMQAALALLRTKGKSLASINHHIGAVKGFTSWMKAEHRIRSNPLDGLGRFNAKEDRRHDRRTIGLDELRNLLEVARTGPEYMGIPGTTRSLLYSLAVGTGLRYSEIGSITTSSFDFGERPSVTVPAAYTKNGDVAVMRLGDELAAELVAYVATIEPGKPLFRLPDRGAKMLRVDLERAGIDYRDAAGLIFDFHALRCQYATLLDAEGNSPRVVQKLMRHSSLELTGRYTKPRVSDLDAAVATLPSLRSTPFEPAQKKATGTLDYVGATKNDTGPILGGSAIEPNSLRALRLASCDEPGEPGYVFRG